MRELRKGEKATYVSFEYKSNKQILQPHCVVIMHCSTRRTNLLPYTRSLMESGVRVGISEGIMRLVFSNATMLIKTMNTV